jgi:hypothetical protein
VALHMRVGESAVAEGALSSAMRTHVTALLARQAAPNRVALVQSLLQAGDVASALDNVTPAELLQIGSEIAKDGTDRFSQDARAWAATHRELNLQTLGRTFGTPKPTLANSYRQELLFLRTFPTLMGYSSRVMAESWESNLLYYAALVDQMHLPPSRLNVLAPRWTASTVENIFATHLEDWPALLRSLRKVGDQLRAAGTQAALSSAGSAE